MGAFSLKEKSPTITVSFFSVDNLTLSGPLFVTETAHNKIFDAKIRSKSDVAPKHVKGERPVKNRTAKSRKRRPRRRSTRDDCIDVYSICRTRYCAHPWEVNVALVAETSVPDALLRIPAVSCVVTSASAGKPRSISIRGLKFLILLCFFLH